MYVGGDMYVIIRIYIGPGKASQSITHCALVTILPHASKTFWVSGLQNSGV